MTERSEKARSAGAGHPGGADTGDVGRLLRWGGTALGAAVGISVLAWLVLPTDVRVPIHIGPDGVDRWAGRLEAALAVPLGMLFVLLVGLGVTARSARAGQAAPGTVLILAASLWLLVVLHAGLLVTPLLGGAGT